MCASLREALDCLDKNREFDASEARHNLSTREAFGTRRKVFQPEPWGMR